MHSLLNLPPDYDAAPLVAELKRADVVATRWTNGVTDIIYGYDRAAQHRVELEVPNWQSVEFVKLTLRRIADKRGMGKVSTGKFGKVLAKVSERIEEPTVIHCGFPGCSKWFVQTDPWGMPEGEWNYIGWDHFHLKEGYYCGQHGQAIDDDANDVLPQR